MILMIEKGRHQSPKVDRSFRFCPFCLKRNAYVIEDEFHFFLVCPVYTEIRNMYLKPEWVKAIATLPTFYSILSSSDTPSILSTVRYLISAFNYRNELLKTPEND